MRDAFAGDRSRATSRVDQLALTYRAAVRPALAGDIGHLRAGGFETDRSVSISTALPKIDIEQSARMRRPLL